MPTPTKGPRLGGSPAHERLMLANLATSLFEHERITTTEAKARRLRPFAEKLITKARRGDLHNRREIMKVIRDKDVVHKLIAEIGPKFTERPGGYTRIVKTVPRKGDNAPMAVIELITESTVTAEANRARGTRFARRGRGGAADTATTTDAVTAEDAVTTEDAVTEDAVTEEDSATEDAGVDDSAADETATDEPAADTATDDKS